MKCGNKGKFFVEKDGKEKTFLNIKDIGIEDIN